jgi:dTDP-4-amino-4,6-dideoxygalactose transaminase
MEPDMNVPLLDLNAEYAEFSDALVPALQEVLDSKAFCNGPAVRALESDLANCCQCTRAIGVSSGTDALLLALMALNIGPGDEVIVPPFTFFATAGVVWRTGAKPVFADIRRDTFNIDPDKIAAAVTPRTRAIIPVHLFGQCADMDAIMAVAAKHDLAVVEDAAQSIGATYKGRPAGGMGTIGCLSFYPTKNLGALGDAGAVLTQDDELADKLERLRNHGQGATYMHHWVGGNFRMDSLQAAALRVKLPHLADWSARRRANAARYEELLGGLDEVTTPTIREHNVSIFNQYVIRASSRNQLQSALKEAGIASGIYYPLSLHQQECFESLGHSLGDFPESEKAADEVLALPVHPFLAPGQVEYVAEQIRRFYGA